MSTENPASQLLCTDLLPSANDRAVLSNHKVIKPEDVFDALKEMEFEGFVDRVREEHDKYVQIQNDKRNDYRKRVKDDKTEDAKAEASLTGDTPAGYETTQANGDQSMTSVNGSYYGHDDEGPAAKRPRISGTGSEFAGQTTHGDTTEDEGEPPEPEEDTEPEDEELDEEEEEEFADAEEGQNTMDDDLAGGVDVDDSNHYRRDADDDSGEDDY